MIVVVKIVGDAGLGVGQVGKNRPPAQFEYFRFEPGPEAFGLGRAALLGQAQGFGTEGRIVLAAVVGFWRVFLDEAKLPPLNYPELPDHLKSALELR